MPATPERSRPARGAAQIERARRHALALELAEPYDGVVTFAMLLRAGLTRGQIDGHVARGAWHKVGRHTLAITGSELLRRAPWWRALWESGRDAALDGVTALLAAGLTGWTEAHVHVTVPNNANVRPVPGVVHHRIRERAPVVAGTLRRVRPEVAVVRAAQWAASDRAAATLLAMAIQQRLTSKAALLARWRSVGYSARRPLLDAVIKDLCSGAESLGELDFAAMCRRRGLPEPDRQVVCAGERGRVYLDVYWKAYGVRVEINGVQHYEGLGSVDDALRSNDLTIKGVGAIALTIPVIGLRVAPERFLDQVSRALVAGGWVG